MQSGHVILSTMPTGASLAHKKYNMVVCEANCSRGVRLRAFASTFEFVQLRVLHEVHEPPEACDFAICLRWPQFVITVVTVKEAYEVLSA